MNKYEARTQDQIIYGRNDISTNPPSKERYGPPKSQHRQAVDKSKNVAFINTNGKIQRKTSQNSVGFMELPKFKKVER